MLVQSEPAFLEELLQSLHLPTPVPDFPRADPLCKPWDLLRACLAELLGQIADVDPKVAFNAISPSTDPSNGDLTAVIPRLSPGTKGSKVAEFGVKIMRKFPSHPLFDLPFVTAMNLCWCIKLGQHPCIFLPYIMKWQERYGQSSVNMKEAVGKVIVEFSSPNIAADFQGRHLRSTIIGSFISSLYSYLGWEVKKINYLGDWGKDIALLGVGWEKYGSEEEFEKDPASHLLEVYHKIHELFLPEQIESKKARDEAKRNGQDAAEATAEIEGKGLFAERNDFFRRMEEGDEKTLALARRIRGVNIANYSNFYGRLGIDFDEYSGESQVNHDIVLEIEQLLKDKGISEESSGACIINMKKLGARSGTERVRDRTGSSTYFMRYLATILERSRKSEVDKMIFVAADRTGHFDHIIKVFEAMGMTGLAAKLEHIQFNDTSHMAEKLGQGYQPHEILDQCESTISEVLQADQEKAEQLGPPELVAKPLGITALLAQELSTKRSTEHAFDIPGMASFKPGTGLELQFQYAKLCCILEGHPYSKDTTAEEYQSLDGEEHIGLLLALGQFPEVVQAAFQSHEPSVIMSYLQTVVAKLSGCLADMDEVEEDGDDGQEDMIRPKGKISHAQSALYEATRIVMENAMRLLGLDPVANTHPRGDTPLAA